MMGLGNSAVQGGHRKAMWLVVPYALVLVLAFVVPLAAVLGKSIDGGWDAYQRIWNEPVYAEVFINTAWIAGLTTVACVALGFPLAVVIDNAGERSQRLLLALVVVPFWTSLLVRSYAWLILLQKRGVINRVLITIGLIDDPVALVHNRLGVVVGMTYVLLPYMVLLLLVALRGIDRSLPPAAATLGASRLMIFWRLTVPTARRGLLAGAFVVFILALGFFITPALLGGASDTTIGMLIDQQMNRILDWQFGAVLASCLAVTVLGGAAIAAVCSKPFAVVSQYGRASNEETAGRRNGIVTAALAGLALVFLVLPLLAVALISFSNSRYLEFPPSGLSLRWYRSLVSDSSWGAACALSLQVALAVSVLATAIGTAAAVALMRWRGRAAQLAMVGASLPIVAPSVVMAVGFHAMFARLGLNETRAGLVIAHTALALPVALLAVSASLSSRVGESEQAAETLGASSREIMWRVILPLARPGIVAAALFAFVTSFDEPVISMFIAGTRLVTLPKRMWDGIQYEIDPSAAAASTVLICISVLVAVFASYVQRVPSRPAITSTAKAKENV